MASAPAPLWASSVNVLTAAAAVGLTVSVAVPSALGVKLTPVGRLPVSDSDGVGAPVAVSVAVPPVPAVKEALSADVIAGAGEPEQSSVSTRPVAAGGICRTGVVATAACGVVGVWHPGLVACTS